MLLHHVSQSSGNCRLGWGCAWTSKQTCLCSNFVTWPNQPKIAFSSNCHTKLHTSRHWSIWNRWMCWRSWRWVTSAGDRLEQTKRYGKYREKPSEEHSSRHCYQLRKWQSPQTYHASAGYTTTQYRGSLHHSSSTQRKKQALALQTSCPPVSTKAKVSTVCYLVFVTLS